MKSYTTEELKNIFNDIINGAVYVGIDKFNRGVGAIFYDDFRWIHFRHYGQTASRKDFEWFKDTLYCMFSDCLEIVPGVYSEYHINYIPQDITKYKAIDLSLMHPNVCGL